MWIRKKQATNTRHTHKQKKTAHRPKAQSAGFCIATKGAHAKKNNTE